MLPFTSPAIPFAIVSPLGERYTPLKFLIPGASAGNVIASLDHARHFLS